MIPKSYRFRLSVFVLVILSAATFAAFRFAPVSEAGGASPTTLRASGERVSALHTALGEPTAVKVLADSGDSKIINLQDGKRLTTANLQNALASSGVEAPWAEPVSLATDDFNGDGYPDLAAGYRTPNGGFVIVYFGNPQAFAPSDEKIIRGISDNLNFPTPFKSAEIINLNGAPDFLFAGDFDRDGSKDLLTAARGGQVLNFAANAGGGSFSSVKEIAVDGSISTVAAGNVNMSDDFADVVVGIDDGRILLYQDKADIGEQSPLVEHLPAAAQEIRLGNLDADGATDLAIVAGGRLFIAHGDDEVLRKDRGYRNALAGRIEAIDLPFEVRDLTLGRFVWDRDSRLGMAALGTDGSVRLLTRGKLDTRPFTEAEVEEGRRFAAQHGTTRTPTAKGLTKQASKEGPWTVSDTLDAGPASFLTTARISAQKTDDLLMSDGLNSQIEIRSKNDVAGLSTTRLVSDGQPSAVLPMRLNIMAEPSLVVMQKGQIEPTIIISAPLATFAVTKNADTNDGTCDADCSLREAIVASNANGTGADLITFNPGINPTLSISSAGGFDNVAATGDLDINSSVTVQGNAPTIISTSYTNSCGDCKLFGVNQTGNFPSLAVSFTGLTMGGGFNNGAGFAGTFFDTAGGIDFFITGAGTAYSITNSTVTNNTVTGSNISYGGGVNVDGCSTPACPAGTPGDPNNGTVAFTNVTFSNNTAQKSGGGINLQSDKHDVNITSSAVTGNAASQIDGGGIRVRHSFGGTITISGVGSSVSGNSAVSGGGIAVVGNQVANITGVTIDSNTSTGTGGSSLGGGLLVSNLGALGVAGSTTLTTLNITNNHADNGVDAAGGGVTFGGFYGFGMSGSTISGNTSKTGAGVLNQGSTETPAQTLAITNCIIRGNAASGDGITTGFGGGLAARGTGSPSPSSITTLTDVTFGGATAGQGNSAVVGGAIANLNTSQTTVGGTSTIFGNTVTGIGGGIFLGSQNGNATTGNSVTINNNVPIGGSAAGQANTAVNGGGAAVSAGTLTYTGAAPNGGTIVGNSASVSGGGVFVNGGTATLSNLTITNNSAITSGGAFFISSGTLNDSLSYINSNANASSSGIARTGGTATVTNNWWGCDGFVNAAGCQTGTGIFTDNPRIDLQLSASPTSVLLGGTSTLTADITKNTNNVNTNGGNAPIVIAGRNWTFAGGTKGTINLPLTLAIPANGVQTKTFTANTNSAACGAANPSIVLDATPQPTTVQVQCADLTAAKTNNVAGAAVTGQTWTWTVTVTNNGDAAASFTAGQTILSDNLPNGTAISYGAPTPSIANVNCTINGTMDLVCTATAGITLAALGGNFNVQFTAQTTTPGPAPGTYANPRSGGGATVDPNDVVVESNEGNNTFSDSVTVTKAATTAAISNDTPDPSTVNTAYTVTAGVTVNLPGTGTPTGTITVSDGTDNCTINLPATSCLLTSTTPGAKSLTATYNGDPNYSPSPASASAPHTVIGPPTLAKAFGAASIALNNGTTSLTFTVSNPNTASALGGVAFSDTLPAGLVVAMPNALTNSCGGSATAVAGSNLVSLSGGSLTASPGAGSTCTVVVNVMGTTAGTKNNITGNVTSAEGGPGGTASASLNVEAPPYIQKSFANCITPPANMIDWYPGDGNANDFFGTHNGTLPNGAAFPAGKVGQAFSLNGTNQYVDIGDVDLPSTFTIDAWVNPTSLANFPVIVSKDDNNTLRSYFFNIDPTGSLTGSVRNAGGLLTQYRTGNGVITAGTFTHVALTYDGSAVAGQKMKFYVNGVLTTASILSGNDNGGTPENNALSTKIGIFGDAVTNPFPGLIDEVELFSRALSAEEINSINLAGTNGKCKTTPSIAPGTTVPLTFTITNPVANTQALTGVTFTDTLPAGLTVASNGGAATCGGTLTTTNPISISLTGATIAVGGQCQFAVTVTGASAGQYTNVTGAVSSTNGGTGNTATALLSVAPPPSVTKTFGQSNIVLNGTTSLTINITNTALGAVNLTGLTFTDTLVSGLVVAPSPNLSNTCFGTATANVGASSVSLAGGTIAAGATCTVSANVQGTTTGVKNNSVQVTSVEGGASNTSSAAVTVFALPTIAKAFLPTSIPFGGTSTMTFTLTNPNSFVGGNLSGLSFTDTLPTGMIVTSNGPGVAVCGGTLTTIAPSSVSFSGGTLGTSGPGNTCMINVTVTGVQIGALQNITSAISSTETGAGATSNQATLTVTQSPTMTTITNSAPLSGTPTVVGQSYAVNVTVAASGGGAGTPTGTVNVSDGSGATCPITLSGGSGTCNLTSTTAGAKTITASYIGDTNFTASSTTASHTVNKASTTTTITNSLATATVVGQAYAVNWSVAVNGPGALGAALTGNVTVSDGVATCTAPVAAGTCNLTSTTAGSKNVTATYAGDSNYVGSISVSVTHQVNKADTTTVITNDTPDPTVIGQNYAVTASVSANSPGGGTPGGTITVTDGTNTCTITLPATSCNLPSTSVGAKTLTATYNGDGNYNASVPSAGAPHTVNKADVTVLITSDNPDSSAVGQNVTVVYTVTAAAPGIGTPTGNVTVSDGVNSCTGTVAAGSCMVALTTPGNRVLVATYAGDANFNAGTSPNEPHVVVAPPVISKVFNPNTIPTGGTTSLQFTITNPAANTVALTGVGFTDNLPAGLTVANATTNACGGTLTTTNPTSIVLTGAAIAINGQCQFSVTVTGAVAGQYTNVTGNVTSTNGGTGNTASAPLTVSSADLSIVKSDGVTSAPAGSTVVYAITATNNGPNAVTGATVNDTFPAAVTAAVWTCSGTGGGTCNASGSGNITNQLVNLPVGATVTFVASAVINPNATGNLVNTATVAVPAGTTDPNLNNNSATDTDTLTAPSVFVIDDVAKNEGNSGTTPFVFTVTKQGGTGFATAVQYTTVDGTATVADGDYIAQSGTLLFGPNETTKTITVLVNGDTKVEPNEAFTVHLLGNVNALIGDADGTGTIVNDDTGATPTPTITPTPTPATRFEGDINRTVVGVPGTGDGDVNVGDQLQYIRFFNGSDCPGLASGEQQRLDAGPRGNAPALTLGDGLFGATDGTAIDAYARHDSATDFDPNTPGWQPTPAGGPTAITNLGCVPPAETDGAGTTTADAPVAAEPETTAAARTIGLVPVAIKGDEVTVDIEMSAQGNEAGTQFSLRFDSAVLSISDISGVNANPDITSGADSPAGTALNVNAEGAANGQIGIVENFNGAGRDIAPIYEGNRRIARIIFHVLAAAKAGATTIAFDDSVVSRFTADPTGRSLGAAFDGPATVNIRRRQR